MALTITVNGAGTFTASMEEGPVSFTASLGAVGPAGPGVAAGGTTGQILVKTTNADYATGWIDNAARTVFVTARNDTGSTIAKGKVVYLSGATGNKPTIALAQANSEATSARTIGVTKAEIANGSDGDVIISGEVSNIDTSAFSAGNVVYLSSSTAGGLTTTLPIQPNHGVVIGIVTRANPTQGTIEVTVQNYQELRELSDVLITSATNLDLLSWDSASSTWQNKTFSTLGLLTSATASSTYLAKASNLSDLPSASTARTNLGLGTMATAAASDYLAKSANLSGLASISTARTNLGLGTAATSNTGDFAAAIHTHTASQISDSTTAGRALLTAADASAQRTSLGLGTMATETASNYALLASPTFTGDPKAPTPATSDNDTSIATTAFGQSLANTLRVDIQTFGTSSSSGSFTWTKPAGAKMVHVYAIGAGGGGAGGSCSTTGLTRGGGAGGAGGASGVFLIPASELGDTVTVTVGAGGTGGAGRSTTGAHNAGTSGGNSQFGNYRVSGGAAASTGSTVVGVTGPIFNLLSTTVGPTSGAGNATTGGNATGSSAGLLMPTSGGGGGGAAGGSTTAAAGGNGSSRTNVSAPSAYTATLAGGTGGTAGGTAATAGTAGDTVFAGGTGGGGGFYITGQATGAGGNGGFPGGGGGGGGASDSGFLSGKGGDGANGEVIVITYF